MARVGDRHPENTAGDFFVDRSCIDCDMCHQLAPDVFGHSSSSAQSVVVRQPRGPGETRRALMALVSCPTASIGAAGKPDVGAAIASLPEEIEDGVFYCGFASESSYGAASYLVRRPGGNVLVDSPRASRPLLERLAVLGGVRHLFLTHRDDVADHAAIQRAFGCERILHLGDVSDGTFDVERKLQGDGPIALDQDLLAIPVPGHTRGSLALLYREKFLFSGDHLWWSEARGGLSASRAVCWYSWSEQVRSLRRLLDFRFEWLLPGHGRRFRAGSPDEMRARIRDLLRSLGGAAGSEPRRRHRLD
jgi:glyoxylase-like metal-dependent hydrolase (beta-lactamase superfamily II)/ferredoxin